MRIFKFIALAITFLTFANSAIGQIPMATTGSNTQNFNSLATTGSPTWTDNSTIANWYSQRSGTGTTYTASDGSSNTGALYSFGTGTNSERALGTVGSGTPGNFAHGVQLRNTSGSAITTMTVSYTLEQWRKSGVTAAQSITVWYKISSSAITALNPNANGTWTQLTGLTLNSPINTTTATALDGNAAANKVSSGTVTIPSLSLANNEYIMIKWEDPDHTGADHGLSIDDVTIAWTAVSGPAQNGAIAASEYGTHTDGANQNTNGAVTYVTWDATNLYVAATGANIAEGMVFYLDKDPQVPVNGGTNANGTNVGFNYDGTSFAELQFRADLVMYVKSGYREYRTANGSNGWSTQTAAFGSYGENGTGNIREFSIPWSAIGGLPTSMNFFSYFTNSSGFVYGEQPTENGQGNITTSARFDRYYTVTTTTVGSSTPPFSRNSYVFNSTSDNNTFGAISVWDFTMNTGGRQIARSGTGAWSIGGSLVVNNGSVFFGSGGTYGATTVSNVNILGGLLSMDQTNQTMNIPGNLSQSAGTFNLSTNVGGDVDIDGNWTRTGGTFNANARAVAFSGTGAQSIGGSSSTTFGYLTINNTSGTATGVTLGVATNVANQLTLTAGVLNTTATNILNITNTATTAVSGGSTTSFVKGPMTRSLPASLGSGSTYVFPTGKGTTYLPFTLVNPITGASAPVVTAEAFDANAGGTAGSTVASMSTTEYWTASATGNFTGSSVSLTRQTALSGLNVIARSTTVSGTYSTLGGTPSSPSINNSTSTGATLGSFVMAVEAVVPTITSLGSAAGCVGTQIVINGTNFSGVVASGVQIGGTAVSSIVSNTGTAITAIIGSGTTGNVTVTLGANTATSAGTFTVYSLPTAPANPTSNSPQCASPGVTLTRTGTPSGGDIWYWQTTNNGTSTSASGSTYNVTSAGTYYINAQSANGCWSATSGSLAITISTVPAIATTPSPANSAVGVCYSGGGAISNVTWSSVATATSYDVYFGAGSLPGTVTSNVATTSYSTGALAASTTYYWMVVAKNSCGDAVGSTTWSFTTAATNCALTYCTPTYSTGGANDYISQVTFGTLSQATASNVSPYYLNYTTTQNAVPSIQQASTYSLSLTFGTDADQFSGVWIDFNQSGTFETSEYFSNGTNAGASGTTSISIFVPFGATLGTTTMRIRGGDDSAMTSAQACGATNSAWGQTQDFAVLIATAGPTIVATPAILALPNVQSGNTSTEVTYSLQGIVLSPASGDIVVTAPSGFEVSLTSGSGFSSTINVPYTGSALAATTIYVRFAPSANNTYYTGNITNAGGGATTANVALSANSYTTLSALFDNFNRTDNTTVGVPSSGGVTAWTETEIGGETFRARIESNMLRLHGCSSTTGTTGGTTNEQVAFDVSSKYPTTFSSTNTTLQWSFNMKSTRSTPSGFGTNTYATAVILGSDDANFRSLNADGYAVIIGNTSTPDPVKLVSFTGGLSSNANVTDIVASTQTGEIRYYSVVVTLNTCTNVWSLQVRDDGTTAFADPAAGSYAAAVTGTNSTHVSKNLSYFGAFWQHSSSCSEYSIFDNFSIPTGVAPVIATGIAGTATTCASTTGLTYTASVPGATTYVWTVPTGWSITAGAGTSSITVTAGTGGQNGNITVTGSNSCGTLGTTSIAVTVNSTSAVSVSITEDVSSPICAGTSVTFTAAPTNGGTTPSYQWYIGASPVGTNSATYTTTSLANGNSVTVQLTSNVVCPTPSATATSNAIVYTVNPILTPSVSIAASPSTTICAGDNVTFTATPTNGGTTPSYQWYIGATTVGTNSATFSTSALANGDVVSVVMTNNAVCPSTATSTSNTITMTVNSISSVSVSINADVPSPICASTSVTFTATPTNGGTTPSYQWYIGASPVGTNSATFTTTSLANGNSVTVQMTSNAVCPVPTTATSNAIVFTVTATPTWYQDTDGDGYGSGASTVSCTQPVGYSLSSNLIATSGDCNDAVEDIYPGADEWCNSTDDDCDGSIDEGLANTFYYQDLDGDGYRSAFVYILACAQPAGYLPGSASIDCNDNNSGVYPGTIEVCENGIDDNCNTIIDENCTPGPINDLKYAALPIATNTLGTCTGVSGTLAGATASAEALSSCITGQDVWYYFTATTEAASIKCTSSVNNILLELQTEEGVLVETENVQSILGNETMNTAAVVPGNTYYVVIRNYNSAQGAGGAFNVCVQNILSSSADVLASNPGALFERCGSFKATYTAASQYIFRFGSSINYTTPTSNTIISLANISGLTFSTNYSVTIDAVYNLVNGAGATDVLTVPGATATNIYINAQPDLDLRSQDTAPSTKPIYSYISTNQFLCSVVSYNWSFQRVTSADVTIGLPTIVNSVTSSRFLQINGTNIPGVAQDRYYRVMIQPVFSTGPGLWYTDYQILHITPSGGMVLEDTNTELEQTLMEKDMQGENFATIYPNPNNGQYCGLNVVNTVEGTTQVRIMNNIGQVVYTNRFATGEGVFNTAIVFEQELANGLYMVEITLADKSIATERMVVAD
jgi:hypothetical protein